MGQVIYPDYFPYLCEEPNGFASLRGDLNGFMRIYWRVKTWKVTATLTGYTNPDGSIISPGPGNYVFRYKWDAQTEEDLVCRRQFELISGADWNETTFYFSWALQSRNNYQPAFYLFMRPGDDGQDAEVSADPLTGGNLVTIGFDNFGDDNISLTYYSNNQGKWGDIRLRVEAENYWSYGGIYNTSTGEPS
jgi:hypothetical protein